MQLGIRPKSDFIHTASWQQLHVITEHWQSDLAFYGDEVRFLQDLISKYFLLLVKEESSEDMQKLVNRLLTIDKNHVYLKETTINHLSHIAKAVKDGLTSDEQPFRDEHARLEDNFVVFVSDFRALKKDVFSVTENIIHGEKLKHLLGR